MQKHSPNKTTLSINSFVAMNLEADAGVHKCKLAGIKFRDGTEEEYQEFTINSSGKSFHPQNTKRGKKQFPSSKKHGGQPVEFLSFIENFPVVINSLDEIFSTVSSGLSIFENRLVKHPIFDIESMSKILLPKVADIRLENLIKFFDLEEDLDGNSVVRARIIGKLFLGLLEKASSLELNTFHWILKSYEDSDSSLKLFFQKASVKAAEREARSKIRTTGEISTTLRKSAGTNQDGSRPAKTQIVEDYEQYEALTEDNLVELVFGDDGLLKKHFPDYEPRPSQVRMSEMVLRAFGESAYLVSEAGTGTGKSIAYLVPAIFWAERHGTPVVISTNTKNLQEQLFFKDIPQLNEILPIEFNALLLKGKANYLCLKRWVIALNQMNNLFDQEEKGGLLPLIVWASETETGDVNEIGAFAESKRSKIWSKINCENQVCEPQTCKFYESCYMLKARKQASQSHLIVVNHALMLSDLAADRAILGNYKNLIIDEAHNLEKVAIEHLGKNVNFWKLRRLLDGLYKKDVGDFGHLVLMQQILQKTNLSQSQKTTSMKSIESMIQQVRSILNRAEHFFSGMREPFNQNVSVNNSSNKIRIFQDMPELVQLNNLTESLVDGLFKLCDSAKNFKEWSRDLRIDSDEMEALLSEFNRYAEDVKAYLDDLLFILLCEDDTFVYWAELSESEGLHNSSLSACPVDVSTLLAEKLYSTLDTIIFTSATLTIADRFDFFINRIGLNQVDPERMITLAVESPFDYREQMLLCVPRFLPSPKDARFSEMATETLKDIVTNISKGTLILFTSYAMLNHVYNRLRNEMDSSGLLIISQGVSGSRSNMLDVFKDNPNSVLLGTASFWEGIDVPGEALENLIIAKLPFLVPTEPIVQAQADDIEKKGLNPFMDYFLPHAVIKLKQGIGRLIRRSDDKGAIIILDHRLVTTQYGSVFLKSLPVEPYVAASEDQLLEKLRSWWKQ